MLLFSLALSCAAAPAFGAVRPPLELHRRWICYYGRSLAPAVYASLQMAVVDPDRFKEPEAASRPLKIAYLSLGEVNASRWYWPKVAGKPFVLGPNPHWPGSRFVDLRAEEWQRLLAKDVIPRILAQGYQGLFLDNLDTAAYLESLDPKKYAGSSQALIGFVRALRYQHPDLLLLSNNAVGLLGGLGESIDGAVVEDVYTTYDFKAREYSRKAREEYEPLEAALGSFSRKNRRPVFVIIYAASPSAPAAAWAWGRAMSRGFLPYVAPISLDRPGRLGEKP